MAASPPVEGRRGAAEDTRDPVFEEAALHLLAGHRGGTT
jgi:hypothetical protein